MTRISRTRREIVTLVVSILTVVSSTAFAPNVAGGQATGQPYVIRADGDLASLVQFIQEAGGRVKATYPHLNVVAAELGVDVVSILSGRSGTTIVKDTPVVAPSPIPGPEVFDGRGHLTPAATDPLAEIPTLGMVPISTVAPNLAAFAATHPAAYQLNHRFDEVQPLHAAGLTGDGVVVAVVDTGLRPGFDFVDPSRIAGCVSVVPADPVGCVADANDGHGTFVSGVIAGQGIYQFDADPNPFVGVFAKSVDIHAPGAALDLDTDGVGESVPILGAAPAADIFMVKAFFDATTPTPGSIILAAVDEILAARESGLNIRVANLSLGTFTLDPGASILDLAVEALRDAGIVPVASVGNTGPALLTAASPASSRASVAVGAGSLAHQERIAADVGFFMFPGLGQFLRVWDGPQVAWFSARGPHADGRSAPDVIADGWVIGVGLGTETSQISIGAGTSFSAPAVAGIAALLAEAEAAGEFGNLADPARAIGDAIAGSGNDGVLSVESEAPDHGTGWVSGWAALRWLDDPLGARGPRPSPKPSVPGPVAEALRLAGIGVEPAVVRNREIALLPGQRTDLAYEVRPNVSSVEFELSDVSIGPPGCVPNPVFGDDELRLAIHGARTSAFPPAGFYLDLNPGAPLHGFVSPADPFNPFAPGMPVGSCGDGSCRIVLADPEPGVVRFSLSGATENACMIRARVGIRSNHVSPPRRTDGGKIESGGLTFGTVDIPAGADQVVFRLDWNADWSQSPTNDLDLFLLDPFGFPGGSAATLDAPERLVIQNPAPGTWSYAVLGFGVHDAPDHWTLSVEIDGQPLPGGRK